MDDDEEQRRAERAAQADYHVAAQERREAAESVKAQVLIDRFVERANAAGLPTEELTASPWSGGGRYRTGVSGWYLKRNRSIGVSTDGGYYVLVVAPERFGRWRRVALAADPAAAPGGQGGPGRRLGGPRHPARPPLRLVGCSGELTSTGQPPERTTARSRWSNREWVTGQAVRCTRMTRRRSQARRTPPT